MEFCVIQQIYISAQISINEMSLKIILLEWQPHLPGDNELNLVITVKSLI